ncbi:MAG TPA: hypothetical protein PKD15_01180 [Candidatus Saccharibacteria bacterium]|jgi:hypothetical protein|nr:hypothetical protein [Candidatus Saccharibacteria bacterium]
MKQVITKIFIVLVFSCLWIASSHTLTSTAYAGACQFDKKVLGVPVWYKYLQADDSSTGEGAVADCRLKLEGPADALPIGIALFEGMLTIGGYVAVVMVFIGGFKYVVSQGEADRAASGRQTAINAVIGLVIVMIAARVVSFIGNNLG